MVDVYPDFLDREHFAAVRALLMSERLPWFFNDRVVSSERHFMFTHTFMNDGKVVNPNYFAPVQAMIPLIQKKRAFIGVSRIKANLYTNQGTRIVHPEHVDIPLDSGVSDKYCIGVYHVNACDGLTVIGDRDIKSEDNQLILFDNVPHHGTTQTDTDTRVVINFNLRTRA